MTRKFILFFFAVEYAVAAVISIHNAHTYTRAQCSSYKYRSQSQYYIRFIPKLFNGGVRVRPLRLGITPRARIYVKTKMIEREVNESRICNIISWRYAALG